MMSTVFVAESQHRGYTPAFKVEKLEGVFTKVKASRSDDKKGLEFEEVTADKGWLVTFPQKHGMLPNSIHVETMTEMKRLGFDRTTVPLVDDDGEVHGSIRNEIKTKRVKIDA